MIHYLTFVDVALPEPAVEEAAALSTFARDVASVLDAASSFAPTLAMLAEFATNTLQSVAVREAAGRPLDERWRAAYDALEQFLPYCPLLSTAVDLSRSYARLSSFLAENLDLARIPARPCNSKGSN